MMSFMKEFDHLRIQLEEVKKATNNFDKSYEIGSGGFGTVFRGELSHSKGRSVVAFKRLDRRYGQGDREFLKEIVMLSCYTHQNLVSLIGFCDEDDEKILVYEYASRGSLDHHLGDPGLTWTQRLKICIEVAKGISYLHDPNGTCQRVIHRDIKSANILLDENFNAKVADFGLAKMGPANQRFSFLVTCASGTPGYCDPQYTTSYTLTKESDVYSFGVVLFEVLCGKLCFQFSNGEVFVPMWKKCYTEKKLDKIIFQELMIDTTSLEIFLDIAFQCLHSSREERPAMTLVVEKLELALESQKLHDLKRNKILKAALHPLVFTSRQELEVLLSKGLLLNEGQTWFSLNDEGHHCLLVSIDECFQSYEKHGDYGSRYSHDYNSRFQLGTYNTRGKSFSIHGRYLDSCLSKFLSPGITYMVYLVFKCPNVLKKKHTGKQAYIAITYKLKGETEKKCSIVHIGDKRENEWLMAELYRFTTATNNNQSSNNTIADLQIDFEDHEYGKGGLEIEGIVFQPLENVEWKNDDQEMLDGYRRILKAVYSPVQTYRSIQEFKLLLSRGVLVNRGKTWYCLNDNGQGCRMISIAECLIPDEDEHYFYTSKYNSRFTRGSLLELKCKFQTHIKTTPLPLSITHTMNLVFKFHEDYEKGKAVNQCHIGLKYKIEGETKTLVSHLAEKREDDWWMVELCQLPSNMSKVDLRINFEGTVEYCWLVEEGIEFHPLENAEHQVLENEIEKEADMQLISDSDDTYWEEKLPNNYKDMIKWSKDDVRWTTKKELYCILCTGFLINTGQEWFFLGKNGKRCHMLSARAAFVHDEEYPPSWQSLPKSRFEGAVELSSYKNFKIFIKIRSQILSSQTTYASYLVYKLPEDRSRFGAPLRVVVEDTRSNNWEEAEFWYIYLVSPRTPVIRRKGDQNTYNRLHRPKIRGIPRQRSDGWMEVQVWEFQTTTTTDVDPICLDLTSSGYMILRGLTLQGIEFRPRFL